MKRVTAKTLSGALVCYQDFTTQELAEAWVAEKAPTGLFGIPSREVPIPGTGHPPYYDQDGNLLVPFKAPDFETLPADFTIEITDVTAEYAERAAIALGKKRREAGGAITDKVFAINMSKNLSPQAFQALLQNTTLQAVERLLRSGSLTTAKSLIQGMDETYYTTQEKNSIIADIDLALGD